MDLINEHEETIEKMKAEHRKMCTEIVKKEKQRNICIKKHVDIQKSKRDKLLITSLR